MRRTEVRKVKRESEVIVLQQKYILKEFKNIVVRIFENMVTITEE